jgi:signal transduction histidine kinase
MKIFYDEIGWTAALFLIYGISVGIVFMAAVYALVLYRYNKKTMFLLYFFMQLSIVVLLVNTSGIFFASALDFGRNSKYYDFVIIVSTILAFLFAKSFFETKKYLPKFNLFFNLSIALLALDIVFMFASKRVITEYIPFSFFLVSLIFAAFARIRQGSKPAVFYLFGWGALILSVALSETAFVEFGVKPMFIGCPLEAVLVAFALTHYIKEIQEEKEAQKAVMIYQARLASMGELLGNIAHQWKQPITNLSYIFMNIKAAKSDAEYVDNKAEEGARQIEFMSQTIDNFRDFYMTDTKKEIFGVKEQISYALEIMSGELSGHGILVKLETIENGEILGYKNQYVQVVLNILSNAKEALVALNTENKIITIKINKNTVTIQDNGGGIKEENLQKIFEPHFTTKPKNSGIGLYMSKIIIENSMNGSIIAKNYELGAIFTITL